ncbi:MAG: radical SAM protein [Candidatus Aenigmatarchaeota archaeon]
MLWQKERNGIRCELCARRCFIPKGGKGFCLVRVNKDNKLYTLNYGKLIAVNVDPIEKKPLFHFYPGSSALSIASAGCNFRCQFCFDPSTMILTDKGIFDFETLFNKGKAYEIEGGYVSFLNNIKTFTHLAKVSEIEKVYKHYYEGELIVIKPFHLPKIKATPSHEFFVYDKRDKKIKKIPARELTKNHLLIIPKFQTETKENLIIDLKEILSSFKTKYRKKTKINEEKAKEILNLYKGGKTSKEIAKIFNFHPTYVRKLIGKFKKEGISKNLIYEDNRVVERGQLIKYKTEKTFIKRYIPLDENLAILFGYYCAEGHVTKSKGRVTSHCLVFSFGKHEKDKAKKTAELIRKIFSIEPKIVERRSTITVEVWKSSVAILFKVLCGDKSHNKKIPEILLNCKNRKIIHSFSKAYFEGDGYKGIDVLEFSTSSKNLAYGIFLLLLKLGLLPSFYEFPSSKGSVEGRNICFSPYFRVKIFGKDAIANFLNGFSLQMLHKKQSKFAENGNYFFVEIDKIEKEPYSGFVYNLEVKDEDHSYPSNFVFVANCCNASISQALVLEKSEKVPGEEYSPEEVVELAEKNKCKVISYTYTEPTIFYEFAFRVAKLAHRSNIFNSFVTNGYITPEALKKFKYLDAATVDFKASGDPEFYKKFMSVPSVEPIFESLKQMRKQRVHIEITNLIVPQIGDNIELCRKLAEWINYELGPHIPFHILQFHPDYKLLDLPFTPVSTLEKCIEEARSAGLRYVYIGNVPGHADENTYCYNCREPLILREGFFVRKINLVKDRCPKCGFKIDVITE